MAQSIAGTNLAANWAATTQKPGLVVTIQWDGTNWVDETAYVLSASTRVGISANGINGLPMLGGATPSHAALTLANDTGRFSQRNTAGALYASIRYGFYNIAVRIAMGYVDSSAGLESIRVFTGKLQTGLESETQPGQRAIMLDALGGEADVQQWKYSSYLWKDSTIDAFIAGLLTQVAVTPYALDKCLMPVPYMWLDDENVWEEIQRMAQTEMCWLWFGETGYCTLRRFSAIVERTQCTTSQLTLNRGNAFYLESRQQSMNAYTKVTVEVMSRGEGGAVVVYTSPEPIEVPAGGSKVVTAQFRSGLWRGITPLENTDWYSASAGGQDMSANVSLSMTWRCQRGELTFSNNHAHLPAFIYGLQVRAYPLVGDESEDVEAEAAAGDLTNYWRTTAANAKELPIRGNMYIQTKQQAQFLATMARDWMSKPRSLISWDGPGAPWLQPLDRVTVTDALSGINEDGWVLNVANSMSGGAYRQKLLILPCASLLPNTGYFMVGTSTYKDSASDKAFY